MATKMTATQQAQFDTFWRVCPRKIGKGAARKAWATAMQIATGEEIIAAMQAQVLAGVFAEIKFTPYPATWLNAERWEDEIVTAGGADPRATDLAKAWRKACQAGNDRAKAVVRNDAREAGVSWESVTTEVTRLQKEEGVI